MTDYPTFQVGDIVTWSPADFNLSEEAKSYRRKKYGQGPFRIHSTLPAPEAEKRIDKQLVMIESKGKLICNKDGTPKRWSCVWFQKA